MKLSTERITNTKGLLRVIPVKEDWRNEILAKQLPKQKVNPLLFSAKKESTYFLEDEEKLILLVGLGKNPLYQTIVSCFRRILSKNGELISGCVQIDFSEEFEAEEIEAALVGFQLGNYHLDFYKKERKKSFDQLEVGISSASDSGLVYIKERAQKIAHAKIEAFKLVDLPPNELTPSYLGNWAIQLNKINHVKVNVYTQEQAKKMGLEAFLAVSRGSAKAPQFIVIEYRHPQADKHLGLVGKGVTFDTGGLNVKTQGMHYMKSDMGGAAAVLAATQLIADLEIPVNLTTIVPAVENAIDKDAYLPSEIIGSHAGLSIEVVDTDAEGRLILADGLSYLTQNYKVDTLIDMATLTGSSVSTFGYECGALFSNDDNLSQDIQEAGKLIGEKTWPLPLWEAYAKEMESEIADIRNYHGKPLAGAITAATFLQAFTHKHPSWAHLDIAGVAFGDGEFSKTKSGTAFGVHLLLKFIEKQL
ncbi:MAG: leucyl aminopeptidase family protein [Bacteroidota bacterium]